MDISAVLTGALLLLAGRRLFWFFVGAVGFLLSFEICLAYLTGLPFYAVVFVALLVGAAGAAAALFFQGIAVAAAGFLAGGYLAAGLCTVFGWASSGIVAPVTIAGGIAGCIVTILMFDWALIGLSSMMGAALIAGTLPVPEVSMAIIFFMLLCAGTLVQARAFGRAVKK